MVSAMEVMVDMAEENVEVGSSTPSEWRAEEVAIAAARRVVGVALSRRDVRVGWKPGGGSI